MADATFSFIPQLALFASSLACTLPTQTPNLMGATVLPGATVIGQAAGAQRNATMASGSTASLIVFEDNRAGDIDLFGVRVDATGSAIDAVPFPITKAPGNQTAPEVVWNGQDWLVGYASQYDPGSGYFATQIAAVRVSAQGVVLDANPLLITNDNMTYFAVGSDGNQWVVAGSGFWAGNSEVRARRITAAGVLLDPGGVLVQASPGMNVFQLAASYAQGQFLFTWDENGLRGRRFTPTLTAIDPAAVAIPAGTGVVLGNGSHYLLAWVHETPLFENYVVVRRFSANLVAMDPGPILVSNLTTSPTPTDVRAIWAGTQWIVSWLYPASDSHVARVTSGGVVLDPGGVLLPDNASSYLYGPALGSLTGGGALQLWHDTRFASADDVYGTPFTAAGSTGAERCLSLGAEAHRTPRVTAAADGYLVTAYAELSTGCRILAWRVDALGRSLDAQPIAVATASHTRLQVGGSAWNGTHHLVAWADSQIGQIYARRMRPDGSWADAAAIPVMPGFRPDVAASGPNFLVTGLRYPSYPQFVFSYGARVRGSDGAVLDSPALLIGSSYATRARVVDLAGRWLVATERHFSHDDNQSVVLLHFVDGNGVVTSAGNTTVLNIQDWGIIDLASAGTSALVVAQTGSNWTNTEIHVQRILPNGAMPAAMISITNAAPRGQFRPSVAWNGREYLVSYETYENNVWSYDFEPDIYGIRLAETGAVVDANGFPLWNSEDHETRVDGDGLGHGKGLFAASVHLDGAFAAPRLQVRVQRPIGLLGYGIGTPGCFGPHGIDANSTPTTGNAGFAILGDRGPTNGLGVMVLGTAGDPIGFDPGLGVLVHIGVGPPAQVVAVGVLLDSTGVATLALPLPAQPSLQGLHLFAQAAFLWSGPCAPSTSNFSTSPGLQIIIQAP